MIPAGRSASPRLETCDGVLLGRSLVGALQWLHANRDEVNRLNVFPVPDGDTGTNMLLTLQAAVEEAQDEESGDISRVAAKASHGSLMGARGNSGVILSQILRGFSHGVAGHAEIDAPTLAAALRDASSAAYRAVLKPREGTILSVAAAAATAATEAAAQGEDVEGVMRAAAEGARLAVERTPSQLAILRQAGVVDSGGYGLQLILEGFLRGVSDGGALPPELGQQGLQVTTVSVPASEGASALELPEEGWGYCTEFLISAPRMAIEDVRNRITELGNSTLVVGDQELIRVHVHTEEPSQVLAYAGEVGVLSKIKVEDMTAQHREVLRAAGDSAPVAVRGNGVGLVAVASGAGILQMFRELGVDAVVQGGQTMNPSAEELLRAVEAQPYESVVVLPNNPNVILTAQQTAGLCERSVAVVQTRTIPQGIAAVMAFDERADLEGNRVGMEEAMHQVRTVEVTHASRTTTLDGLKIKKGDPIALIDDQLTSTGSTRSEVIDRALETLEMKDFEVMTIYRGAQVEEEESDSLAAHLGQSYPDLEVEVQDGGQELYPFILSLE